MKSRGTSVYSLLSNFTINNYCGIEFPVQLTNKEPDPACQLDIVSSDTLIDNSLVQEIDRDPQNIILRSCDVEEKYFAESGIAHKRVQTRRDFGTNTNNDWSLTETYPHYVYSVATNPCRNQIYAKPINALGDLMRKPFRLKKSIGAKIGYWSHFHCDGTSITGDNSMANNGAQVIMKNRVPPGGFSSGLW